MSGHSKWATTKRQKEKVDAKRGAAFTKVASLIAIAARHGGDPETNFQLRMAIDKARAVNMPKDNIERAIKRGTGEGDGVAPEELLYEATGPAQSQFVVSCLTDSRNRTAATIRHLFDKHNGAMGAVMWNFEQKGVINIESENLANVNFDDFELELIDAGAEDIQREEEGITIYTAMPDLQKVKQFLDSKNIVTASAGIEFVAKDKVEVTVENDNSKIEKIIDALEECDDVVDYYTNLK